MHATRTLPGIEKYLVSAAAKSAKPTTWQERVIERANDVSIFDVLEDYFQISVPRSGQSYKSDCPFSFEHADGGLLDKGWRTYPGSNSSMCFVMHGYMGPVRLVQMREGIKPLTAAERILRRYRLDKHRPWRERMTEIMIEVEQRDSGTGMGDPALAAEALNLALRAEPTYAVRQFDDDVMHAMEVVLDRLDVVMQGSDPEAVREWYDRAKSALVQIVQRKRSTG